MRHAAPAALDRLEPLLDELRRLVGLREKARGTFYRSSRAFLHFHEDPAGLFADVRLSDADFTRLRVTTAAEQRALLSAVRRALGAPPRRAPRTQPVGRRRRGAPPSTE